ncbi:MAG: pre-mRNA processing RNA-helicase [Phylliscum demangeonii]|nr:MAG: pre-mRNA processing RNA-helicase [Phylliscum demangeonii]
MDRGVEIGPWTGAMTGARKTPIDPRNGTGHAGGREIASQLACARPIVAVDEAVNAAFAAGASTRAIDGRGDRMDRRTRASKTAADAAPTEEEKKAERLAKLEAWKKKQAEERERKRQEQLNGAGSTRSLLEEMDHKPAHSPAADASPASRSPTAMEPELPSTPYAGKFDPKEIAKKATAVGATGSATLGTDIAVPALAKASATSALSGIGAKADGTATAGLLATARMCFAFPAAVYVSNGVDHVATASALPESRGNVGGFGFGSKAAVEIDKPSAKRALKDFGEEESSRKKLEKLPTPLLDDADAEGKGDAEAVNGAEEDDDVDMHDAGTEEETAAAARAAAEKRDERLQTQGLAPEAGEAEAGEGDAGEGDAGSDTVPTNGDLEMTGPQVEREVAEQEDIDPLDAFMSDLSGSAATTTRLSAKTSKAKNQPEALFGDDDVSLNTIEANPGDILAMASKVRKKKELPTVNHSKMNYDAFRKDFYHEPAELAMMTEEAVAELRLELDGIKVRGVDVPKPVQKWSQCGLGAQTLQVIQKLDYERPTAIQAQAIPAIMSGRDVIGVAKTGSGKTIAFLLPMFRHIKDQKPLETLDGPVGLVMTPTRELATQIHKECKPFLKALNLRAVCAYGGAPIKDQIADLKRGAEIIVCTPGRMIDLLAANSGRVTNLRRVTYLVLDEADRMFDMGFEPQVMKIIANIRPHKQTVLFSATFPRQMEALARKALQQPVEIIVGGRSVVAPEITQVVEVRSEESKFLRLLELLGDLYDRDDDARTLVFVDRQESADNLLRELMRKGYPCMSIHGGKDQVDRNSTIDDFKAGVVPIMIATSVAARGLDVKQLKLVVNYDAPNHLEDYVHRAGRTGRAGNTGTAVTFLTEEQDRYSVEIGKALRQSGQAVPAAVQALVDAFTAKVKAGKEKASGSGFGGKGLEKLDFERDAARTRERRTYKTGEEGDEPDEKADKPEDIKVAKAASAVQPAAGGSAPAPAPAPAPVLIGVPKGIDLDGKITVHRTEGGGAARGGGGAARGGGGGDAGRNPLDRVGLAVADIHSRLNKAGELRTGVPVDNKGPDAGAFHATLEINDFPQKARWAVTNRTNVAKILEATATSITTKGSFYAAGKEPQPGENPKLYILVEGDTEVVVTNAMRELMRLLKEGTTAAMDSEARAPATGRYQVV